MFLRKKHAFSLIEILITLPLLALFISIATHTYTRLIKLEHLREQIDLREKEDYYFFNRMQRALASYPFDELNLKLTKDQISFDSENGVHQNPSFSGLVQNELVLKNNQLALRVTKEKELVREERFFSHLEEMKVSFKYLQEDGLIELKNLEEESPPLSMTINLSYKDGSTKAWVFEL